MGTGGYSIPVGSASQLKDLPWNDVNQIQIGFNEGVNVTQASLTLTGSNVPSYSFSNFSYNASTHIATWTLTSPIAADRLHIDLASSGPNAVTDAATGTSDLDGEWTDGTSAYPSGNGTAGGDFNFSFNVLPADTNQDGIVNGQDIAGIASHWLATSTVFNDINGDGIVNGQEIASIASHWLSTLPAAGGGAVERRGDAQRGHKCLGGRAGNDGHDVAVGGSYRGLYQRPEFLAQLRFGRQRFVAVAEQGSGPVEIHPVDD